MIKTVVVLADVMQFVSNVFNNSVDY